MKKITGSLFLGICMLLLLSSCSTMKDNTDAASVETLAAGSKYDGIYKYDYEYDSEELKEDHYIVLETASDGKTEGRYYGTSDEFDEAREGYLPGFFAAGMQKLEITGNEITFEIELENDIIFSKPVKPDYKTGEEVPDGENPVWDNRQVLDGKGKLSKRYKGKIAEGEIVLDMGNDQRVFKRLSSE